MQVPASLSDYSEDDFKKELFSPYKDSFSQKVLIYAQLGVLALLLTRNNTIDPIQDYFSTERPLGELSQLGDISGMMVPNLIYISYQALQDSSDSKRRSLYMLKASLFAGGTTFFLKRIFNQKRPNSNDRNSFPSGHTTTAFAFAGVITVEHPNYKYYAYGLATLVGISRINDNAHYLHDVVMGASIGTAYAYSLKGPSSISFSPFYDGAMISSHFQW